MSENWEWTWKWRDPLLGWYGDREARSCAFNYYQSLQRFPFDWFPPTKLKIKLENEMVNDYWALECPRSQHEWENVQQNRDEHGQWAGRQTREFMEYVAQPTKSQSSRISACLLNQQVKISIRPLGSCCEIRRRHKVMTSAGTDQETVEIISQEIV